MSGSVVLHKDTVCVGKALIGHIVLVEFYVDRSQVGQTVSDLRVIGRESFAPNRFGNSQDFDC